MEKIVTEYDKLYDLLSQLIIIKKYPEDTNDIEEFNKQIFEVFRIYKKLGYSNEITENDFLNMFPKNDKVSNMVVNDYMKTLFSHKDDLGHDDFRKVILSFNKLVISKKSGLPIYGDVKDAITMFNKRNKKVVNDFLYLVNKNYKNLSIPSSMFSYDKLEELFEYVSKKRVECAARFERKKDVEKTKTSEIKLENKTEVKKVDIEEYCNILTNGKFKQFNDGLKKSFIDHLPYISEVILKLMVYRSVYSDYIAYSLDSGYDILVGKIMGFRNDISSLDLNYQLLKDRRTKLSNKKLFLGKRDKMLLEIDENMTTISDDILSLRDRIALVTKEYLDGFYSKMDDKYKISEVGYKLGLFDLLNTEKFFGLVDILSLPINIDEINNFNYFKNYGVVLPDINSDEFERISKIAYSYYIDMLDDNNKKNKK